ncbi:MAG: prolipoprotein diacylglyceryl transferase [Pirellulaceae bacterium]|nr:MAG: prolipoprotein diacylglyceryl transferase [Pirellulaceae bacterium]
MYPTLFRIPHQIGPLPVFGWGWALVAWAVYVVLGLGVTLIRGRRPSEVWGQIPFALLVAAVLVWVFPALEETGSTGQPIGLAIRSYGVMLLLAMVAAVGLAYLRARQVGLNPEIILSLAIWLFVGGIAGARAFYVIEYWDEFQRETIWQTVAAIAKFTEGGLVVYGAVLGGLSAGAIFVRRHNLPILAMADLIAPSLAVGLSLGRIGCFLTGCCFGGVCGDGHLCVAFPFGAPAYVHQFEEGTLWGIDLRVERDGRLMIKRVVPGSAAERAGLRAGQRLIYYRLHPWNEVWRERLAGNFDREAARTETEQGERVLWKVGDLPATSRPVYPTQILASVNAALLAWLAWTFYPIRRRDGTVFALMFTLYPVSRFLLEILRDDEPGQFGTPLTISQWFALLTLILMAFLWWAIWKRPAQLAFGRR